MSKKDLIEDLFTTGCYFFLIGLFFLIFFSIFSTGSRDKEIARLRFLMGFMPIILGIICMVPFYIRIQRKKHQENLIKQKINRREALKNEIKKLILKNEIDEAVSLFKENVNYFDYHNFSIDDELIKSGKYKEIYEFLSKSPSNRISDIPIFFRNLIEAKKEREIFSNYKDIKKMFISYSSEFYCVSDIHKRWVETCIDFNRKDEIMEFFYESVSYMRRDKFGMRITEILDFYYNKAVEFEENGDYKTASVILGVFVSQDIKYKDALVRYQKLLKKLEKENDESKKMKEKDLNQVVDPNLTRVVSDEGINKKYEFIREIGQGGMGIVYEAKDRKLNRKVAIKKLKEELSINPREKKRFIEEAQNVAILNHPNIISIYEIVEEGKDVYIVFEFIDGKTVNEILANVDRIKLEKAIYIIKEVCKALSYSHSKNIVHRDIKPSNIMIANPPVSPFDKEGIKEGFVKVMDFGIARELKDTLTRLTGMVDTSGTFAYMAPEQHLGKFYKSSDIYSLGITLYEMICGELPFKGPDFLAQKRELAYKSIKEIIPEAPGEIEKIISKCLNNDLEKRYKSADELLDELEKLKI